MLKILIKQKTKDDPTVKFVVSKSLMDHKLSSQNEPKNPYIKKILNTMLDVLKIIHCAVEQFETTIM